MNPNCRSCRLSAACLSRGIAYLIVPRGADGSKDSRIPSIIGMIRMWRAWHPDRSIMSAREDVEARMDCIPPEKKWSVAKSEAEHQRLERVYAQRVARREAT